MMFALIFSHGILLFFLDLGPLVNNFLNLCVLFGSQVTSYYILVMSVYKIRSFTVALQNRIILKKGFEIYIVNKVIEIEYFGPYWID